MQKKQTLLLLVLSFVATLIVFQYVRDWLVPKKKAAIELVPNEVFFAEHVAPIIYEHCVKCHRPNGSAPFSLMDYEKVFRKKKTIRKVVGMNIMPPWPADPSYSHFIGENVLTQIEKDILFKWMDQGARLGDTSKLPSLPQFSAVSNIGKPDVVVYMDSLLIEGNNRDRFFVIKTPFELNQDTFIRGIEFVPGPNQLVHHLNADLFNYDFDKKQNVMDGNRS